MLQRLIIVDRSDSRLDDDLRRNWCGDATLRSSRTGVGENDASGRNFIGLNGNGANAERRRCSIDRVSASAARGCTMICRKCGLEKPPGEFYDGKYRCKPCLAVYFRQYERKRVRMPRGRHERSAEVTNVSGDTPRPASVYLKPEAIYHARCEQ